MHGDSEGWCAPFLGTIPSNMQVNHDHLFCTGATVMFMMASQTVSENSTASVCVELTDTQGGLRRSVPFTITGLKYLYILFKRSSHGFIVS